MCGILGTNYQTDNFKQALHLLDNRGPDNQTVLNFDNNQFGHTRLAIIDLDDEANQPMEFDDIIITFNGEIYNYKELIINEQLNCITKSDTEVIIRLYQKYDAQFLNNLNGMFSFCLFDKKKNKFFCARDKFGKKPFYYYSQKGKFIYSSEIKSILKLLKNKPPINMNAFEEYLSFMTPITTTFYSGIEKLAAGHYLVFKNKELTISKYYDIDKIETIPNQKEEDILENVENLLIDSVKQRLNSDVKVATLLSGGLDSSIISALYTKIANQRINTFCIGYDEYTHYSELAFAKQVSKHINSIHHEVIMTKKDFIETIDLMLEKMDEPFADSASIPTYFLSKFIHRHGIKVALSGEGSDESFLGYDNYFNVLDHYKSTGNEIPFQWTKEWEYNNRAFNKETIYRSFGETFTEKQKQLLLKNYKIKNNNLNDLSTYPPFKWMTYIDFKIWIAEVLMTKIDRMSMSHSLELRAPFLDYRLVEYLLTINEDIKKGTTNKYLLKTISTKYLPKEIIHRKKKGFSFPFIEWLFEEYGDNILNTILNVNKELNLFNEDYVKFIYNEAKEKKSKQHLWNLYIFSRWYNKHYKD